MLKGRASRGGRRATALDGTATPPGHGWVRQEGAAPWHSRSAPGARRFVDIGETLKKGDEPLAATDLAHFETLDLIYRSLCALLYNYVPTSGHPGGSISSGRFVEAILYDALDYDLGDPDRADADLISYAAGHKAMGLYAMWALRDEIAAAAAPDLLPADGRRRLRLEDLLGFRRNPITATPLFRRFRAKPLDGHPTPATPFVKLSTGASGVGVASSIGLAFGARDYWGADAPRVHIVEGEGGLTPGRVAEALAAAGTASLSNVVLHLDWNQASIDSDRVCREGDPAGRLRAVGPAGAASTCTTGTWSSSPTGATSSRSSRRSGRRRRWTPASRRRSSTAPSRAGSTASRARRRTAPGTSSAPTGSTRRSPS